MPVGLWLEAQCAALQAAGQGYYVAQRGDYGSGVVMVKVYDVTARQCQLYVQQRDFDSGELGWVYAMGAEALLEGEVDRYTQQACSSDPDLWVIEVEKRDLENPFEGQVFE